MTTLKTARNNRLRPTRLRTSWHYFWPDLVVLYGCDTPRHDLTHVRLALLLPCSEHKYGLIVAQSQAPPSAFTSHQPAFWAGMSCQRRIIDLQWSESLCKLMRSSVNRHWNQRAHKSTRGTVEKKGALTQGWGEERIHLVRVLNRFVMAVPKLKETKQKFRNKFKWRVTGVWILSSP